MFKWTEEFVPFYLKLLWKSASEKILNFCFIPKISFFFEGKDSLKKEENK